MCHTVKRHSRADHTCSDQAWTSCTYLLTMFSVWICDQSASFMAFLVLCCRFAIIPHPFFVIVCTVGMGLDELHEPGPEVSSYLVDRTNDSFTLWVHWCFVLVRAIPFHVLREWPVYDIVVQVSSPIFLNFALYCCRTTLCCYWCCRGLEYRLCVAFLDSILNFRQSVYPCLFYLQPFSRSVS